MRRPWWVGPLLVTTVVVIACMAFVDRPVASWVQETLTSRAYYEWANRFYLLLLVGFGITGLIVIVTGARSLMRRMRDRSTIAVASAAAVGGVIAAELLKLVVGRSPAYPDYVEHGLYSFHPLGPGTFPSATTTAVTAMATVLMARVPRHGALWVTVAVLIAASLPLTNSHWLSDVIGGAFVGAVIGRTLVAQTIPDLEA